MSDIGKERAKRLELFYKEALNEPAEQHPRARLWRNRFVLAMVHEHGAEDSRKDDGA